MEITKTLFITDREKWRKWLEDNFQKEKEIWIIIYKIYTGKKSIQYEEAVEEALCFGWIDGVMRRIDDEKYAQRFSPRSSDSVWSLLNKKRALRMIKEGKMIEAGLNTIRSAKKTGKWQTAYSSKIKPLLPPGLKKVFRQNTLAFKNFNKFSNSQQLSYIYWMLSAKKDETRRKRISIIVERSSKKS